MIDRENEGTGSSAEESLAGEDPTGKARTGVETENRRPAAF
jgi:hypothetical protein